MQHIAQTRSIWMILIAMPDMIDERQHPLKEAIYYTNQPAFLWMVLLTTKASEKGEIA